MDPDHAAALEELRSILCDLPTRSHALVRLELPNPAILGVCHEVAADAEESLLVHAPLPRRLPTTVARDAATFEHTEPATFAPRLRAAARTARGAGHAGAFLAILPEFRIEALGPGAHLASEHTLGPDAPLGSRVVCFYTDAAATRMPRRPSLDACHSSSFKVQEGTLR